MSKRGIVTIMGIVILSFLVVIILYAISDEPFSRKQNFTRIHKLEAVQQRNVLDLNSNSYYIAGTTTSHIFFGNREDSLELLITDTALNISQHIRLSVAGGERLQLKDSRIEIDSPFFYIKAGSLPGILRGMLDDWQATRLGGNVPFFAQAAPISPTSFAFQPADSRDASTTGQNFLRKISGNRQVKLNPELPERRVDNYLNTKGLLRYSKKLNRLVFIYFYRDQYQVLDTSLNLQYTRSTIDTVSWAHINPEDLKHTPAPDQAIVNGGAQVYEGLLFIDSNLIALNDDRETLRGMSVIDVHDIKNSKYLFSFYLPDYQSFNMRSFKIMEDRIVALYDHYAVTYSWKRQSPFVKQAL